MAERPPRSPAAVGVDDQLSKSGRNESLNTGRGDEPAPAPHPTGSRARVCLHDIAKIRLRLPVIPRRNCSSVAGRRCEEAITPFLGELP